MCFLVRSTFLQLRKLSQSEGPVLPEASKEALKEIEKLLTNKDVTKKDVKKLACAVQWQSLADAAERVSAQAGGGGAPAAMKTDSPSSDSDSSDTDSSDADSSDADSSDTDEDAAKHEGRAQAERLSDGLQQLTVDALQLIGGEGTGQQVIEAINAHPDLMQRANDMNQKFNSTAGAATWEKNVKGNIGRVAKKTGRKQKGSNVWQLTASP